MIWSAGLIDMDRGETAALGRYHAAGHRVVGVGVDEVGLERFCS